jgi:hypothetical protein
VTARAPLVLANGQLQQLQAGDLLIYPWFLLGVSLRLPMDLGTANTVDSIENLGTLTAPGSQTYDLGVLTVMSV